MGSSRVLYSLLTFVSLPLVSTIRWSLGSHMLSMSTHSDSEPPPLLRRSRMSFSAPCRFRSINASRMGFDGSPVNVLRLMYPIFLAPAASPSSLSSIPYQGISGILMLWRVIFIFMVLPVDGRFIFSMNVVPASPRRWLLTKAVFLSVITESSICRMMSPFFRPASAAGIPAYGSSITTCFSF